MRTMKSSAAAFAVGFAATLAILFSTSADAAEMCVRQGQPPPHEQRVGLLLMEQMEGAYQLSNGQRVKLYGSGQRLWVDFGRRREVGLDRVGEHQFAARDGSVNLSYRPELDEIAVVYTADMRGRYVKAC